MAKAVITIEDIGGEVNIKSDFGGAVQATPAHYYATAAIGALMDEISGDDDVEIKGVSVNGSKS